MQVHRYFFGSALVCSLFAMLSIGLALIGMFSSLKSFLTALGLGLLGEAIMLVFFKYADGIKLRNAYAEKKTAHAKNAPEFSVWTLPVIVILLSALAIKALSNVLNILLG